MSSENNSTDQTNMSGHTQTPKNSDLSMTTKQLSAAFKQNGASSRLSHRESISSTNDITYTQQTPSKRPRDALSPTQGSPEATKQKRPNSPSKSPTHSITDYENADDAFEDRPIAPTAQSQQSQMNLNSGLEDNGTDTESITDMDADFVDEGAAALFGHKLRHTKKLKNIRMVPISNPSQYGTRHQNKPNKNNQNRHRQQAKDTKRQQVQFPVILEETDTGVSYDSLAPHHLNLWKSKGVIIKTQYRLRKGKWLISCENVSAQRNVARSTNLSGSNFKCHIPKNTTKGVIGPFNSSVNVEEVKKSIQKEKKITDIQRIFKGNQPTSMLKVSFESEILPKEVRVGAEIFSVSPFRRTIIRCSNCQGFNHKKLTVTL